MRRAITILLAGALLLALSSTASAAVYGPPRGKVFTAGSGGYGPGAIAAFQRQSGKHPAVFQYSITWRARKPDVHFFAGLLRQSAAARSRVWLSVGLKGTSLNPKSIAQGKGDSFLVNLGFLLAVARQPAYVAPLGEMNNGRNRYSAYNLRGRSKGKAYSTGQFKRAWRRAALILRGGSVKGIDARLRKLGMPGVRTKAAGLLRPRVALVWAPLSFGNPEIARNHPRRWWPGSGYVDWVGTSWYSRYPSTRAMSRFYGNRLWRNKPFAFSEYGVWGKDRPAFIKSFFSFVRRHHRVRMIGYYQSAHLSRSFRLSSHRRSRKALRRALRSRRYLSRASGF